MSSAPNGYFAGDLILFGSLEKGSLASKGFIIQPPDLRGGRVSFLNEYQEKIRTFLSTLSETQAAQIQWSCNSDYQKELKNYYEKTKTVENEFIARKRNARFAHYWDRMQRRQLRREELIIFVTNQIDSYSGNLKTKAGLKSYYENILAQMQGLFAQIANTMQTIFGADTNVKPMGDFEHYHYFKRFLNPSLAERFDFDYRTQFNSDLTIQENCWSSDGVGFENKGFYMDGYYHSIFTLKRWPSRTYPGIILRVTGLPFLDYQVTVNVYPIPISGEVRKEEKMIERLEGELRGSGKQSLVAAIRKRRQKVDTLASGFTYPFYVEYIVRVWATTERELQSKSASIKNSINNMNGAQYYECALPTTSKKLFFASWPGWTGSNYKYRRLYSEDAYLADLLPFSATFTGHLEEAEAIYEGTNNNLVGIRTFIGGVPQHSVLLGMSGAGKSVHMQDMLTQTAAYYDYTVIVEEGFSYKEFTESLGEIPIIVQPDGQMTINYFDTGQFPLSQMQISTAVALTSRMMGDTTDEQVQQVRQAQLGQYITQLYIDTFNDWGKKHSDLLPEVYRMALATNRWRQEKMETGATYVEAYSDLKERISLNDDEALSFIDSFEEGEITKFIKEPGTETMVMNMACAYFKREEYPVHSSLIELMQFSRFAEHSKAEVDNMATLLGAWTSYGQYGKLFDGTTNVSLTGKVAHFELGLIPEQAIELKTAAGLLITGFTRQHIVTLPRSKWKRIIFEEVARFLDVPGGEKVVAESYAQLRKFSCWTASIVQQYSKFKQSNIRSVIMGNSKQFFLMRQFDRSDIEDIAKDISLPESVMNAIQTYPLIEQQSPENRYSSICYYSPSTQPPLCGTVRNYQIPEAGEVDETENEFQLDEQKEKQENEAVVHD